MKVAVVGGGPAGLYFAISLKLRQPEAEVDLFERNAVGVTFGWGVVFSDQTVERLLANDPVSGETIAAAFAQWDDIEVSVAGRRTRSSGHGFIGIGRKALLAILAERAAELGVRLHYGHDCDPDLAAWDGYDFVIAADGGQQPLSRSLPSRTRSRYRAARQQVHLARHHARVRRLHFRDREN